MTLWLRQSTSTNVVIGPMTDFADGYTPKTALTTVSVNLSKHESGTAAVRNDANTPSHIAAGNYKCALNATDTNTNGYLYLTAGGTSCLPVWHTYMVVPATVYDAIVTTTGHLPVDVVSITNVSAAISAIVGGAITNADVATSADVSAIVSVVVQGALVNYDTPTSADVSAIVATVLTNSQIPTSAAVSGIVQGALVNYDVPTSADVSVLVSTVVQHVITTAEVATSAKVSAVAAGVLTNYDVPTSADVSAIVSAVVGGAIVNYGTATSTGVSALVSVVASAVAALALTNHGVATSTGVSALVSVVVSTVGALVLANYDVPTSNDVSTIVGNLGGLTSAQASTIMAGALTNADVLTSADIPIRVEIIAVSSGAFTDTAMTVSAINRMADYIMTRGVTAAEAASANGTQFPSLLGAISKLVNKVQVSASTLNIYRADNATILGTQTLNINSSAAPITGATPQ